MDIKPELEPLVELIERPSELIERKDTLTRDDGSLQHIPAWRWRYNDLPS